jgi:hypothetical protein
MITKAELIEMLKEYADDNVIVLSIDEEGNGFNLLRDVTADVYCDGETYIRELTDELKARRFNEDDLCPYEDGVNCITLWP